MKCSKCSSGKITGSLIVTISIMTALALIISLTSGHGEPFVASIILDVLVGLILLVFRLADKEWP